MLHGGPAMCALLAWLAGGTRSFALAAEEPRRGFSLAYEQRRDDLDFHFDNPSRFRTPFDVPHFFEQHYRPRGAWLVLRAGYRLGALAWESELGLALDTTASGDDFDTFFEPGANTVVYGTAALVRATAWRVRQSVGVSEWRRIRLALAYTYRSDHFDFPPSLTTIRQTSPPSSESFWNADRETTRSERHALELSGRRETVWRSRTTLALTLAVAPLTTTRLTTWLPDKYPGAPIRRAALGGTGRVALALRVRCWRRLAAALRADHVRSWRYAVRDWSRQRGLGLSVEVGLLP
jgi:hypothetical protein